jgi:putative membrane protein
MMGGGMMGMGSGGFLLWIVNIAAIVIAVIFIVKSQKTKGDSDQGVTESPLDTAKKRYARGEITREEYDQIRRDLT